MSRPTKSAVVAELVEARRALDSLRSAELVAAEERVKAAEAEAKKHLTPGQEYLHEGAKVRTKAVALYPTKAEACLEIEAGIREAFPAYLESVIRPALVPANADALAKRDPAFAEFCAGVKVESIRLYVKGL